MGGGANSDSYCKKCHAKISCQICEQTSHTTMKCPFIYSACRSCGGIHKLMQSTTVKNPDNFFLKCPNQDCLEFQWLE
ncbi:hypothetical protein BVC80_8941g34 [Macleaya cordata]|uniref:Zinc finger protein n=1 Tax=Macleaya cordata TaxID=56857 RepID=A0A200QRK2_MACCD|nr:hypothetical protein BVC80_8941g34 [Macleaya cordata]